MSIRIVGNRKGVKALLVDPGVARDVHRRTLNVARAAGADDHNVYLDNRRFGERARGAVVTATKEARVAQEDNHNLERAVDAARH